jgi:hypothetical protein
MRKPGFFILLSLVSLSACTSVQSPPQTAAVDKRTQLDCEQQALIAQEHYVAVTKTPLYTSRLSTTWQGGARSDTGKWVFDAAFNNCMRHAHYTAVDQP